MTTRENPVELVQELMEKLEEQIEDTQTSIRISHDLQARLEEAHTINDSKEKKILELFGLTGALQARVMVLEATLDEAAHILRSDPANSDLVQRIEAVAGMGFDRQAQAVHQVVSQMIADEPTRTVPPREVDWKEDARDS